MKAVGVRRAAAIYLCAAASALAITAAVPASAAQEASVRAANIEVPPIEYRERKLANGLTIYSMRDTSTPNVLVSLWYDVGSKHDPEARSGFAHLFEHILSRKTRNMPYNMINHIVADVGGTRNASLWYDRTNYFEIVPAPYLETMLWTHAERMARPVVDADVFENERSVVKEELRQRVLAPPYGRVQFLLGENSWDLMPHRRPPIGSIEDLDSATLEDARAFHEAFYGPDTSTLIVSGNFDQAQLDAWIDHYFGDIPRRANPIPLEITTVEPRRTVPRLATKYVPNVPLPMIGTTWRIPGSAHPDLAALSVLQAILARGDNSRLHQSLVNRQQLATSVSVNLMDVQDGGYFAPVVTLAGAASIKDAERALAAEIDLVRTGPPMEDELAEAKNELLADALRDRETFSNRAFAFGEALVRTGDPAALDRRLALVQQVTAADVQRVALAYLAPEARVDLRYLNENQRPEGEEEAWLNPVLLPAFASVPPAQRQPIELAPEGEREQPPGPGPAVAVAQPAIVETRLANGMEVVAVQTGEVPIGTMGFVVKGGSSTDPEGRSGLASFAADLATRGTRTRTAQQIAAALEALGATINSGAGGDGQMLFVTAPAANLEKAGEILADIVQNAAFPEEEVERQRRRSIDSLSVSMNNPGAVANMVAQRVFYGDAPYGRSASPTPASLRAISREDLVEHHRRLWHPANSALVVTGGIEPDQAIAMAQRLLAGWQAQGPAPQLPEQRAGTRQAPRTVVIDLPGAGQAAVVAGVRALDRADPDFYNLLVANAVLGVGSTGRLFEEIRTKRGLSYGASSIVPARRDAAVLSASAQTQNASAAEVAQIFLNEFSRLANEPLSPDQVDRRKVLLTGAYGRQLESSAGFGSAVANLIQQGQSPAEAARYIASVQTVTADAATAAARRFVSGDQASLVIVGDASQFIDSLRALRPDVEVIPATELDLDALARRP
jgi:zinc protease